MRPVFKFLQVDNHQAISDEIYNYLLDHTELLKFQNYCFFNHLSPSHIVQHVPLLEKFLDNYGLKPTVTAVILVPPGLQNTLHVDVADPYVRILWPIKNCQGSITKMFDVPRECLKLQFQDDSVGGVFDTEKATNYFYQIVGDQTWSLIHEFELVQPVLIDVSVAHEVHTAPDAIDYRISFTMGFDQDLPISKTINAWSEFAR